MQQAECYTKEHTEIQSTSESDVYNDDRQSHTETALSGSSAKELSNVGAGNANSE